MKRFWAIVLAGILCCGMLAGCSGTQKEEPAPTGFPGQNPAAEETAAPPGQQEGGAAPGAPPEDKAAAKAEKEGGAGSFAQADDEIVDLTRLSSTMVYAEVYNMMVRPKDYIGKTIKVKGQYYASHNPESDIYYHFVVIEDATACCSQGLEFILDGGHTGPGDYPEDETPVEVTGVWGSYEEDGDTYYYIAADKIAVL